MALPSTEEILNLSSEHIADFINDQTSSKTLSAVMKQLNTQLFSSDERVREGARRAIERLGFAELV